MKTKSLLLLCLITFTTAGAMYVPPKVVVPRSAEGNPVPDVDLSCFDSKKGLGAVLQQVPLGLCGQSPTPEEQFQDALEALDAADAIDRNGAQSPEPNSATILHSFTKEPVSRHKLLKAKPIFINKYYYTTNMIEAIKRGDLKSFLALLNDPAAVNTPDCHGQTPLHHALLAGCYSYFCRLLIVHADPNKTDEHGDTPLHLAVRLYQESVHSLVMRRLYMDAIALLFAVGADLSIGGQEGHSICDGLSENDMHELNRMLKDFQELI